MADNVVIFRRPDVPPRECASDWDDEPQDKPDWRWQFSALFILGFVVGSTITWCLI